MATQTPTTEFWTVEMLAARYHRTSKGIYKLIYDGKLPASAYFKAGGGGRILFRPDEVLKAEQSWT
jgi:hypothetical protein